MARVWPDATVDEGSLRRPCRRPSQGAGRRRGGRQICHHAHGAGLLLCGAGLAFERAGRCGDGELEVWPSSQSADPTDTNGGA